jgi:hypothetical protein
MTPQRSPYAETVKLTAIPEVQVEVVTIKRHDVHLLRPFLVFWRSNLTGEVSSISDFNCAASAAHAHHALLKQLQKLAR